jgi:hypothetical protein
MQVPKRMTSKGTHTEMSFPPPHHGVQLTWVALPEELAALACIVVTPINSIKQEAQQPLKGTGHSTQGHANEAPLPPQGRYRAQLVGEARNHQLNLNIMVIVWQRPTTVMSGYALSAVLKMLGLQAMHDHAHGLHPVEAWPAAFLAPWQVYHCNDA